MKEKLENEIQARKDLEKLNKQIEMTITSEGLRIELLEDKNGTFYQSGSAQLSPSGQELLALLAAELKTLPNQLQIEGHTDAAQYSHDANYSNWELSADRANSARRLLQQDGVRADQVTQVRGYADQLLRVKSNPYDPSNRRISILVKNKDNAPPPQSGARAREDGGDWAPRTPGGARQERNRNPCRQRRFNRTKPDPVQPRSETFCRQQQVKPAPAAQKPVNLSGKISSLESQDAKSAAMRVAVHDHGVRSGKRLPEGASMAIVAGVDFGTLSVRVTLVDSKKGPIGTASASYPLHRRREDPNYATQSHADQMAALAAATKDVLKATGIERSRSCRHRARHHGLQRHSRRRGTLSRSTNTTSGATIVPLPRRRRSPTRRTSSALKASSGAAASTRTSGDLPSSCIGCATIRKSATAFVTALEHCDMVAATLAA